MIEKEQKAKEFKNRLRIKGTISSVSKTKKGNIKLIIESKNNEYSLIVLKSHKERYKLASEIKESAKVSVEGIRKINMNICTKLKKVWNIEKSFQSSLDEYCPLLFRKIKSLLELTYSQLYKIYRIREAKILEYVTDYRKILPQKTTSKFKTFIDH